MYVFTCTYILPVYIIISTVIIYITVPVCIGVLILLVIVIIISVLVYKKRNSKLLLSILEKKFNSINKPHFIDFSRHRERLHSAESRAVSFY